MDAQDRQRILFRIPGGAEAEAGHPVFRRDLRHSSDLPGSWRIASRRLAESISGLSRQVISAMRAELRPPKLCRLLTPGSNSATVADSAKPNPL